MFHVKRDPARASPEGPSEVRSAAETRARERQYGRCRRRSLSSRDHLRRGVGRGNPTPRGVNSPKRHSGVWTSSRPTVPCGELRVARECRRTRPTTPKSHPDGGRTRPGSVTDPPARHPGALSVGRRGWISGYPSGWTRRGSRDASLREWVALRSPTSRRAAGGPRAQPRRRTARPPQRRAMETCHHRYRSRRPGGRPQPLQTHYGGVSRETCRHIGTGAHPPTLPSLGVFASAGWDSAPDPNVGAAPDPSPYVASTGRVDPRDPTSELIPDQAAPRQSASARFT